MIASCGVKKGLVGHFCILMIEILVQGLANFIKEPYSSAKIAIDNIVGQIHSLSTPALTFL